MTVSRCANTIILSLVVGLTSNLDEASAEGIVVRSPFDGYVVEVPIVGDEATKNIGASEWVPPTLDTNSCNAGFIEMDELTHSIYSEDFNKAAVPLVEVHSPLLDKLVATEKLNLQFANKNWERLNNLRKRHDDLLDPQETKLLALRRHLESFYVNQRVALAIKTNDKHDEMPVNVATSLQKVFNDLSIIEQTALAEQLNNYRNGVLVEQIEDAWHNRTMAKCSVDIAEKTRLLGNIYCPFDCTVSTVFVAQGQWVLKGDPLLEIEPR